MEERSRVTLHGFWTSAHVYRVIWALKLKGVAFEYVEEDLMANKSAALLKCNPVHKKVPVLVHGGKAVAESAVILQYIEETWPDSGKPLMPADPYDRALVRFWLDFGQQKHPLFFSFFKSSEEDREDIGKQALETLRIIQDEALGGKEFFGGDGIGLVDLSFGWLAHWLEATEEVVGLRIMEPHVLPQLCQWAIKFRQEPVIKENLPDKEALVAFFKRIRASRKNK